MFPRIRIIDLRRKSRRRFTDCFTHLRTGETAPDERVITAGLLADGLDFSLKAWSASKTFSPASLGQHSRHELR